MVDRPPSATTSRISMTGRRDFGMKFIAPIDDIPQQQHAVHPENMGNVGNVEENVYYVQMPAPALEPELVTREAISTAHHPPPTYWDRYLEAGGLKHDDDENDEEDEGCHPFWMGWVDMLRGMGLIIAGCLKIPFVIGHGVAKTFHYIPTLYHDDTVRKWPKITGFPSACAASFAVLWFGLLDGMTDWFVLPYKCARKDGFKGFFKGIAKGFASILFKIPAGVIGFATHPFFGIYKEAAKFKLDIKRERNKKPRKDVASLI
ncbi:uncharacterized protein GGS22DRAFT_53843 [Annulohypoxylon maeteangense]|uniref:uncharacterized protein n=1 Tax=Annulohypoxylon maeteangense TaxID=1927788 RepID=UPI0020076F4A|nr:uncharacterized protein GGS22DRAFT_53843 [Annulohypoxylon maeteangense]KAI0882034.1 hypothetical protein GGS22DRAFT_53843 [Annulohypoxylon maeteangense]